MTLKTLSEFNEGRTKVYADIQRSFNEPSPNGIACPDCGKELMDTNPYLTLTSNPPKKNVHCPACKYIGYRIA